MDLSSALATLPNWGTGPQPWAPFSRDAQEFYKWQRQLIKKRFELELGAEHDYQLKQLKLQGRLLRFGVFLWDLWDQLTATWMSIRNCTVVAWLRLLVRYHISKTWKRLKRTCYHGDTNENSAVIQPQSVLDLQLRDDEKDAHRVQNGCMGCQWAGNINGSTSEE